MLKILIRGILILCLFFYVNVYQIVNYLLVLSLMLVILGLSNDGIFITKHMYLDLLSFNITILTV